MAVVVNIGIITVARRGRSLLIELEPLGLCRGVQCIDLCLRLEDACYFIAIELTYRLSYIGIREYGPAIAVKRDLAVLSRRNDRVGNCSGARIQISKLVLQERHCKSCSEPKILVHRMVIIQC